MTDITISWKEKFRTRIPSWTSYLAQASIDRRHAVYGLLPILTSPRQRKLAARLWSWTRPKGKTNISEPQIAKCLERLQQAGLVTDMPSIDEHTLKDITEYFKAIPCHDPFRPHLGKFAWNEIPSNETNMGMYTADQIVRSPHVIKIFNQPLLLQLAEAYIGCKPTLDNISCWWSYSERSTAKGTQRFHRDFDTLAGFKVFFYLTDVGLENGPHEFIQGSHISELLGTAKSIPDALLWQNFYNTDSQVITGSAGSSFIADTFGIHRGRLPVTGSRLMLSAQYTINTTPHGPLKPIVKNDSFSSLDKFINRIYIK